MIAIISSLIATILLFKTPEDLIICFGVLCIRLAEAFGKVNHLRWAIVIGTSCWVIYATLQSLYLFVALESMVTLSTLWSLCKYYQPLYKKQNS